MATANSSNPLEELVTESVCVWQCGVQQELDGHSALPEADERRLYSLYNGRHEKVSSLSNSASELKDFYYKCVKKATCTLYNYFFFRYNIGNKAHWQEFTLLKA